MEGYFSCGSTMHLPGWIEYYDVVLERDIGRFHKGRQLHMVGIDTEKKSVFLQGENGEWQTLYEDGTVENPPLQRTDDQSMWDIERIRWLMHTKGMSWDEALEHVFAPW